MSQRSDLRSAAGEQLSKLEAELDLLQNHIINANRDSVIAACRDGFLETGGITRHGHTQTESREALGPAIGSCSRRVW